MSTAKITPMAAQLPEAWRLLIYTVPSEPSRKRAFVWRELKKAGAIYLRDGVCALPEQASVAATLSAIADKIEEFGGEALVVPAAQLPLQRGQAIVEASQAARREEYLDVAQETERLLQHVRREMEHRDFTFAELEELEIDLGKLRMWVQQVKDRDYFGVEQANEVDFLLERCEAELNTFMEEASSREGGQ